MARKKKEIVQEVVTEDIKEDTKEEQKESSTTNLSYKGTVTVSVTNGKRTLSKKTYHNSGTSNMFKFICDCLAGSFLKDNRPCRITLFKKSSSTGEDKPEESNTWQFTASECVSPYILHGNALPSKVSEVSENKAYVIYEFRVPCSYISVSGTEKIIKLGLYTEKATAPEKQTSNADNGQSTTCAFLGLTKTDESGTIVWDGITVPSTDKSNFQLLFSWKIEIGNK